MDNAKTNPKVILYLPRGPIFQDRSVAGVKDSRTLDYFTHDDNLIVPSGSIRDALSTPQELLAAITEANIVTINYRIGYTETSTRAADANDSRSSPFYRYPTPVHDTLTGFEWVLQALRPEQLFVFGSNIGGSLAIMLALTESNHVHAVAAHEPVCDWTGLDDYCAINTETVSVSKIPQEDKQEESVEVEGNDVIRLSAQLVSTKQKSRHRKRVAPHDLVPLLKTREYLFDAPSGYFDSFASPMLFLRSAGKDVPKTMPEYLTGPDYPTPVLKKPIAEEDLMDLWDIHMQIGDGKEISEGSAPLEGRPSRRRKAISRWPPYGLDYGNDAGSGFVKSTRLPITLPWVRFFARSSSDEDITSSSSFYHELSEARTETAPPTPKSRSKRQTTGNNSVLSSQAKEMVDVMRRACFWGEESGNGEERVTLRDLPQTTTADDDANDQKHQPLDDPAYLETVHESGNWFLDMMYSDPKSRR